MLLKQWTFGDRVVHLDRPEWGVGVISGAVNEPYEGKPAQRLTIRFDRAGVKTITSALANLVPADEAPRIQAEPPPADDPLMQHMAGNVKEVMLRLPDACTDPFSGPVQRLKATLLLFRYSEHGGALLDWAAVQTGLRDPMTRFSRHELEDLYRRFVFVRDEHLKKLIMEVKKNDPLALRELTRTAPKNAQQVLRRFDSAR
ncbi:MAG: DUF3553 domain-containing protein [Phycisphaerales bacterium]|jgi:hypothetical protein|nr:DUF3553 domain-containing protein [Planctomycetaceae bacterium]MCE2967294.1 DUF3553 domain-containing protein [Phycisphaeraceae bacterium]